VTFERGSKLSTLGDISLMGCSSLSSISLPASIRVISALCFRECEALSIVGFESGCELSTLGRYIFCKCFSLKSICLPPFVGQLTGIWMSSSWIDEIRLDGNNSSLKLYGKYVMNISRTLIIRYFGADKEVVVSQSGSEIGFGCFSGCRTVSIVRFESGCIVSTLGQSAFEEVSLLMSICIPSSIRVIEEDCFCHGDHLSTVVFEIVCQVSTFGKSAFVQCGSLKSICIPHQLKSF
jgi:hypothetical protein